LGRWFYRQNIIFAVERSLVIWLLVIEVVSDLITSGGTPESWKTVQKMFAIILPMTQ